MASDEQKPGPKIESPPEVIAPSERKEISALPPIAAKADDLEEIKKAVEDAASVSGGLWLSYLFVLSYIAIAAGAVTHEDLLLERAVKLPFLNVELPLLAFFALAPFVVLIIHAYALMHFIMLGKKASRFHNELRLQFPDPQTNAQESGVSPAGAHKDIRDKLRRLLPSNIFVQILAGPPELRTGIFGFMLKLIASTTLVVLPILLLLLLQIQFLPFHDVRITNAQRAALFLDILFLWLLRPPILADLSVESIGRARIFSQALRGSGLALAVVMSIAALLFSIVVATIPGEWQETALAALDRPRWQISYVNIFGREKTELVSTHELLFAGPVNPSTRRRDSLFSNTLVLLGFNIYEALKIDDPKKLAWKEHLFDLRARHLEQAVLDGADLTKADLYGAQLQGASLAYAQLQGASLNAAEVRATDFSRAFLWHAQWGEIDPKRLGAVQLKDATWKPIWQAPFSDAVPWTAKAYDDLRDSMNGIPEDKMRENALKRIEILDCGNPGKTLALCDPAADPPREVLDWQNRLAGASVDDAAYAKSLAAQLQSLVCANDDNAIHILRGISDGIIGGGERLRHTDREAPALVDFIMSKDCPVSASLTDNDRADLLKIKQDADKRFPPPPEPKKEK